MSDLNPRGIPIEVNGVERRILFTLNAIDAIQDKYEKTLYEVLDDIINEYPSGHTLRDVLIVLLDDEVEREKYIDPACPLTCITEKEAGWLIGADNYMQLTGKVFEAYNISLPKPEDNDPNRESGQQSK